MNMTINTSAELLKKRKEVIAEKEKKKTIDVMALKQVRYDGEDFFPKSKFKMTKEDYESMKPLDAVISKEDRVKQEKAEAEAEKAKAKGK